MLLEHTILQLDIGLVPSERARELGQLGYMQWLGALPGNLSYRQEAERAYSLACPFALTSPAIAVFCDLVNTSIRSPLAPMALSMPAKRRRGGARARRALTGG